MERSRKSASSIFSKRNYSMHRRVLERKKITNMRVNYYDIITRNNFYPKWWLDVLDLILGKEKVPLLRKRRLIQLIESDLQSMMCLFTAEQIENRIDNDNRIFKANYGSRKKYSIENIILEKWLICDMCKQDCKHTTHNITDLQACYDRQLLNICSIVQELTGRNW